MNFITDKDYEKTAGFLCGIFALTGLWHPNSQSKYVRWSYLAYSIIFLFLFAVLYSLLMVCNIFFLTDLNDLTNRLFMSLTEAAFAIKAVNFFLHNGEYQEMLVELKKFHYESSAEGDYIRKRLRFFQIAVYIYFFLPNCAAQALSINAYMLSGNKLIFSGWYPGFDWQNDQRDYFTILFYQHIGIFLSTNVNMAIDAYYCFVMHMITAQYDIFGKRLRALKVEDLVSASKVRKYVETHRNINLMLKTLQQKIQWAYFSQVCFSR